MSQLRDIPNLSQQTTLSNTVKNSQSFDLRHGIKLSSILPDATSSKKNNELKQDKKFDPPLHQHKKEILPKSDRYQHASVDDTFGSMTNGERKGDKNDKKGSTLSLHIAAYENSIAGVSAADSVTRDKKTETPIVSNSETFPRQQPTSHPSEAETQTFHASHKLLDVKQQQTSASLATAPSSKPTTKMPVLSISMLSEKEITEETREVLHAIAADPRSPFHHIIPSTILLRGMIKSYIKSEKSEYFPFTQIRCPKFPKKPATSKIDYFLSKPVPSSSLPFKTMKEDKHQALPSSSTSFIQRVLPVQLSPSKKATIEKNREAALAKYHAKFGERAPLPSKALIKQNPPSSSAYSMHLPAAPTPTSKNAVIEANKIAALKKFREKFGEAAPLPALKPPTPRYHPYADVSSTPKKSMPNLPTTSDSSHPSKKS